MRMRKKPNLIPRMEACSDIWIREPESRRGRWKELYPEAREVRLEVGCGKGKFTAETAAAEPDILLLAMERVPEAMVMAMEKGEGGRTDQRFFHRRRRGQSGGVLRPGRDRSSVHQFL